MTERILKKLDEHLGRNDYAAAEKHLLYWLEEAKLKKDDRVSLLICNELMGLYRKLGEKDKALEFVSSALNKIKKMDICGNIGAATTYLNCATVYKAFGMVGKAIPLFEEARHIYEKNLESNDERLGGLYNNMALALVDSGQFTEAYELYSRALEVMSALPDGEAETAITYLNMASAAEAEKGIEAAEEKIREYIEKATELLDMTKSRTDGGYAFVCEKCAPVFGYYGYFLYENELKERARRIYEGA